MLNFYKEKVILVNNNYEDYWLDIKLWGEIHKKPVDIQHKPYAYCLSTVKGSVNQSNWFPVDPKARQGGAGRGGRWGGADPIISLSLTNTRSDGQTVQFLMLFKHCFK